VITLIKIGGSLITNKTIQNSFRQDVMRRLAQEVRQILDVPSPPALIIGHGSGSFGHFEAKKYNTANGVYTSEEWVGFSKVAYVASQLNMLVMQELQNAHIAAVKFQPSASIRTNNGKIEHMSLDTISTAMRYGLIPIVHGDVAFDVSLGGTIASTETIFTHLVKQLDVANVILLGEVDGVYDDQKQVIPHIHTQNYEQYKPMLGSSDGVDVTGGMLTKVSDMLALAQQFPKLTIHIINGLHADLLPQVALNQAHVGTLITANPLAQ
jgi:isopentenyl phosphate kinase